MKLRRTFCAALLAGCSLSALSAHASPAVSDEDAPPYADTLLGNWGGLRTDLNQHGIELGADYRAQFWGVPSGGAKQGTAYDDNLLISADIDGAKAFGSEGTHLFFSFLNNNGGHPNSYAGAVQGVDNIEVTNGSPKLYEAWVEQSFLGGDLSLLLGLHDLNSEFYVTPAAGNFIGPQFGIGQEWAQTGRNGPSVFPTTSLAARVKYLPTEDTYVSVAAFDATSGDPDRPNGNHFDGFHDGALLAAEAGYAPDAHTQLAIGGWGYTHETADIPGTGRDRQWGIYAMASDDCYQDDQGRSITPFIRVGYAGGHAVQSDWSYQAGVAANGWVPSRPKGEIGLGVSQAHNSNAYLDANPSADDSELGFELYYRDHLMPGVSIQPDVQYIVNPGTDASLSDATVLALKMDFAF